MVEPVQGHQRPAEEIIQGDVYIAGDFDVAPDGKSILCVCPCGCGGMMRLRLYSEGTPHPEHTAWSWDGNRTQPTLLPSIRDVGGCRYHGFLRSGIWSFEGDSGVK